MRLFVFGGLIERNARAFPLLNALSRSDISAERDVRRWVKRATGAALSFSTSPPQRKPFLPLQK